MNKRRAQGNTDATNKEAHFRAYLCTASLRTRAPSKCKPPNHSRISVFYVAEAQDLLVSAVPTAQASTVAPNPWPAG